MAETPQATFTVQDAAQVARTNPITKGNTEPGFANTYGPGSEQAGSMVFPATAALGVGGLGLLLLYQRHLQDKAEREKKLLKSADVISQLPGVHPKDMLLGAALGGGAGLLYDVAKGQPEGKRLSTTLKRILTGAGLGAVGGNFAGDRARRYVTNTYLPFGYGGQSLMPRSLQHLWDAGVADKPSYDPKALAELPKYFGGNKDVAEAAVKARYELSRRSQNVHRDNPDTDVWQRNKGDKGPDYFSLNEKNPEYKNFLYNLFLPNDNQRVGGGRLKPLFVNPPGAISAINSEPAPYGWRGSDLFGANTLLGEQQVTYAGDPMPGDRVRGRILDRFDITPEKPDMDRLFASVRSGNVFRPSWHGKPTETAQGSYYAGKPTTNSAWLKSLLSRILWDKWLVEEHPWVSQQFEFAPKDKNYTPGNEYALQFQNAQGKPVGLNIDSATLDKYLANQK